VYDTSKLVTIRGTVTAWTWSNPHCLLELDVKDDAGAVVHWVTETPSPVGMANRGWSKQTLKPGDEIVATIVPAKNGRPFGTVQKVELNGRTLEVGSPPGTSTESGGKP
jgi:hypothetical protein